MVQSAREQQELLPAAGQLHGQKHPADYTTTVLPPSEEMLTQKGNCNCINTRQSMSSGRRETLMTLCKQQLMEPYLGILCTMLVTWL